MSTESMKHTAKVESAILFMQKEHASTLRDLHEEISQLQRQCSDLTFQLTMRDVLTGKPDAANDRRQDVQEELDKSITRIEKLEQDLAHRNKRIEQLESEAQLQKKSSLDENRKHVTAMNTLYAEVKSKTKQISDLTAELRRCQCLNKNSAQEEIDSNHERICLKTGISSVNKNLCSNSSYSENKFQTTFQFIPKPPSEDILYPSSNTSVFNRLGHRKSVIRLDTSTKSVRTFPTSSASTLMEGPLKLRHLGVSKLVNDATTPDVSSFLQPTEDVIQVVDIKKVPVLPPIPANSSKTGTSEGITPPS